MKRLHEISLIVLILLANEISVTKSHEYLKNAFRTALHNSVKELKILRYGILPGTRWCGFGNIARNYSDLGSQRELDTCCRTHDFCDDYMRPRAKKYGLYNENNYCTSFLCECELQFHNCLKQVPGLYVSAIGKVYFKMCKQCFHTYRSIEECDREGLVVIEEEKDRQGNRVFCARFEQNPQWGHRTSSHYRSPTTNLQPEMIMKPNDFRSSIPRTTTNIWEIIRTTLPVEAIDQEIPPNFPVETITNLQATSRPYPANDAQYPEDDEDNITYEDY